MNVLADFHHYDLWLSLQMLCNRLGYTLYRPYGMEWYDNGYLKLYGDLRRKDPNRYIAKQYLVDTIFTDDKIKGVGRETYYGCVDAPLMNLLTFDKLKNIKIDIVICTVHENEKYFYKIKDIYHDAKFIRQVGNNLDTLVDDVLYPNLLASATAPFIQFKKNKVLYRQEFDMNLFKYRKLEHFNNLYSFQGALEFDEIAWDMWLYFQHNMKEYSFKCYGVGNKDGCIFDKRGYIEKMLQSTFIFQIKDHEGYGHVLHNAFALGRIPIIYKKQYIDKIIGPLLEDEKTCLFIEDNIDKTIEKIKYWSQPDRAQKLSENAYNKFHSVINFDNEFNLFLKPFFNSLI